MRAVCIGHVVTGSIGPLCAREGIAVLKGMLDEQCNRDKLVLRAVMDIHVGA